MKSKQASDGQRALSDLLAHGEKHLRIASEQAGIFQHRGTKGAAREHPIKTFLEGQLPDRFGFLSGEGIDALGNRTAQLDLIIYDRIRMGPFFAAGEDALIPVEAILAVIEVKSVLDLDAMKQFAESIAQIYRLRPNKKTLAFARSGGAHDDGKARVQSTLFAYDSNLGKTDWAKKELARARDCVKKQNCPVQGMDRIVVLNRGVILPAEGQAVVNLDEIGVLRIWFFHLINFLDREAERRRPFPWSEYADPTDENSRVKVAKALAPGRADRPSTSGKTKRTKRPQAKRSAKSKGPSRRPRQRKKRTG